MNPITMQLVADKYIRLALEEDINGEDVTTCSVMPDYRKERFSLFARKTASLPVFRFSSVYLRCLIRKHRLISLLKMEIRSQTVS